MQGFENIVQKQNNTTATPNALSKAILTFWKNNDKNIQ